jgi:hypothetical protein
MKSPEYKDNIMEYSKADRAIIQASLNAARLANRKGSAKKAVASKAVAKKAVAKKATPKAMNKAGSYDYTPGSKKSNKATYTTGSGVRYASTTAKKATPKKAELNQKTKSMKNNPVAKFITSRVGGKSGANSMAYTPGSAKNSKPKMDSRFTGLGSGTPKVRSGANSMAYTPGSTKGSKSKTDSRFTGLGAGKPKPRSGANSMQYTPGSTKNKKYSYTAGSAKNYK